MTDFIVNTPVVFIIFNRPDTTQRVFDAIAQAKPRQLFVVADGPRADRPGEAERCAAARAIIEQVDWECEVQRNYAEQNMGCGVRPSSGIGWAFSQVEEAIILEDDCLPHPTFFRFCQELLARYRHDTRVMSISGDAPLARTPRDDSSYFFSRFPHNWGWATWRRTWALYDFDLTIWPTLQAQGWLADVFAGEEETYAFFARIFQETYDKPRETLSWWDYQLIFTCLVHSGLSIHPNHNLVSNIGHDPVYSTHTKSPNSPWANLPQVPMEFPLVHPRFMLRDASYDRVIFRPTHTPQSPWQRLMRDPVGVLRRRMQRLLPATSSGEQAR